MQCSTQALVSGANGVPNWHQHRFIGSYYHGAVTPDYIKGKAKLKYPVRARCVVSIAAKLASSPLRKDKKKQIVRIILTIKLVFYFLSDS